MKYILHKLKKLNQLWFAIQFFNVKYHLQTDLKPPPPPKKTKKQKQILTRLPRLFQELSRRIKLNVGERVKLTGDPAMKDRGERDHMYVNDPDFIRRTVVGDNIYVQDGPLRVVVDEKGTEFVR